MSGRLGRVIRISVAMAAMAMITVAAPSALVMMGRWRFGSAHPWAGLQMSSFTDLPGVVNALEATLRGQFTDQMMVDVILRVILLVGWVCVVVLVISVVLEVLQQLRGGNSEARALRGFGWSQALARSIAAGLLLIVPVHGVAGAESVAGGITNTTTAAASFVYGTAQHLVASGETLWEIADQVLGDPLRWTEIWSLNQGHQMIDGRFFEDPHVILPGWLLQMPASRGPVIGASDSSEVSPTAERWQEMDQRSTGPFGPGNSDGRFVDAMASDVSEVVDVRELADVNPHIIEFLPANVPINSASANDQFAVGAPEINPEINPEFNPESDPDSVNSDDSVILGEADSSDLLLRLGSATMLATGILAGLAARRRRRLRASTAQMRPMPLDRLLRDAHLGTHNSAEISDQDLDEDLLDFNDDLSEFADDPLVMGLQMAESSHRMLRLDLVLRIVAVPLIHRDLAIAVVLMNYRGDIEIVATGDVALERPFRGEGRRWVMSAQVGVDRLIEMAHGLDYPCPALVHLGNAADGRELYVDLEVIGVLSVVDDRRTGESAGNFNTGQVGDVLRAVKATLENSLFGSDLERYWIGESCEVASLGRDAVGLQEVTNCEGFDELLQILESPHSGKVRVAVVSGALCLTDAPWELWTNDGSSDIVIIGRGAVPATGARLRVLEDHWVLDGPVMEDLEFIFFPVGLSLDEAEALAEMIEEESEQPVLVYEVQRDGAALKQQDTGLSDEDDALVVPMKIAQTDSRVNGEEHRPHWSLMVRVMGTVDVVNVNGTAARLTRSKSLELLAWCVTHRGRSTRSAARTAMWELNVRDATFANVVSEARRGTAALVPPPKDRDWLQRTLTEELVLDPGVVSDAEIMRVALDRVDECGVGAVVAEVEAAVALIRGMPCEGSNYLWPEAEGISSDLILVATSLTASLAMYRLAQGDVQGVFRATAAGLLALPGHEELIALRMRAHGAAGDLAGVKQEWAAYQRVMARDPWSSGEPAPKLRDLTRELLGRAV